MPENRAWAQQSMGPLYDFSTGIHDICAKDQLIFVRLLTLLDLRMLDPLAELSRMEQQYVVRM